MRRALTYLVWFLGKLLLSLRYHIRVDGLDKVKGLKSALILPNHPAYVDPPLVLLTLLPALEPRPMLMARMFHNPLLFWLPKALGAIEIPNMNRPSAQTRDQAKKAINEVIEGLHNGKNHILWPAGRAQRQNSESLGAARSVADVLREVPDANIVVVRTRGLWGSMFSYARTGAAPKLIRCLLKGIGILVINLVFFAPRRRVHITVQQLDRASLPDLNRVTLNPFLEDWYNAPGPEPPTHVPYHRFARRRFEFPQQRSVGEVNFQQIKLETKSAVFEMLTERLGRELSEKDRDPQTKLDTLGLDSLDRMSLSLAIEQRFGFSADHVGTTVGELCALAQGLIESAPPKPPSARWFKPPTDDQNASLLGQTIPEAFVRRAIRNRKDTVAADDLAGTINYEQFLVGALAMAKRFKKIASPNVGLMLPASVATDMVFLSLHLADKQPVLMNWTTGPAHLSHAATLMKLTHVITSQQFVDRTDIRVTNVQHLFLEDVRAALTKRELFWILLRVRCFSRTILRQIPNVSPDTTSAVLFTSGSEKAPKAVPLTHRNILSNIQSVLDLYHLSRQQSVFGFLPPFHSFGLTATSLLPILTGMRVVHHPDPTDASGLARKIATYKPTIVCATPTFFGYVLDRAQSQDLVSLQLVIVGAERCPESLFERLVAKAPTAKLVEGYGITECSPLISGNHPENIKPGSVGQPLPGVQVAVVDPESFAPRKPNEMGMLLVAGPNVFPGYIGHDEAAPFHNQNDKHWYITGDLARVDQDGFIYFCGRLKRFLKAGGEMISLPALEEPFIQQFPPTDDGPRVAVEGIETDSGRCIVLFTTEDIPLSEANAMLFENGFRGVLRVDEVRRIDHIPTLGTGKTDYKQLRSSIPSPDESSAAIGSSS